MTTKRSRETEPGGDAAGVPFEQAMAEVAAETAAAKARAAAEPESHPPYISNEWAGLPHFECSACPVDRLDEDEIREHVRQAHGIHLPDKE